MTPARAVALTIRLVIVWWAVWAIARGVGVVRMVGGPLAVRGAKMRGRARTPALYALANAAVASAAAMVKASMMTIVS